MDPTTHTHINGKRKKKKDAGGKREEKKAGLWVWRRLFDFL